MNQYSSEQLRPLSPWSYFGLQILFSIPVVGFIFLIVFSISSANINRRNVARSYFCVLVVALVIFLVVLTISVLSGAGTKLIDAIKEALSSL